MTNIFRSLSFAITQLVYPLIKTLYEMFNDIASTKFFTVEEIRTLSGNIYIVISVCMLFALGLKLVGAIVNPELLTDQKKGVRSVALHAILAVFLIILIPIGFSKLYDFQGDIMDNHLVEKIVLGADVSDETTPGQILAAYAFYSFCQPNDTISIEEFSNEGGDLYNRAISEDIYLIKDMDGIINTKTDGKYDIEYHALLSPVVGLFLCYEMVLLCMDIALRTIKLGLLQLLTPLILCGYVIKGSETLQKWAKEVGTTYVLLFLKIGMVSFMIFGLSRLPDFLERLSQISSSDSFWYDGLVRTFVIIGLLQLIKQIPEIINTIFGTNIKTRGGIRGRLGEMAAIGNIAQNAWDQLRQHPIQSTRRVLSAPLSAAGGMIAHNVAAINRGRQLAQNGHWGRALGSVLGGAVGSLGALGRGARQGWQNGNLQGIGGAGTRYEQTHPEGSTLLNRIGDNLTSSLGIGTRIDRQTEQDKTIRFNGDEYEDPNSALSQARNRLGLDGRRSISVEQLENTRKSENETAQRLKSIADSSNDIVERSDSNIRLRDLTYTDTSGNAHTISGNHADQLAALKGANDISADELSRVSQLLEQNRRDEVANVRTFVLDGGGMNDYTSLSGDTDIQLDGTDFNNMVLNRNIVEQSTDFNLRSYTDAHGTVHAAAQEFTAARTETSTNINAADLILQTHSQEISDRVNTDRQRNMQADHDAVQAYRNGSGGNNNNSSSGGH